MTVSRNASHASLSYLPAVDGMRTLAIGLVLWHHAPFIFGRQAYEHAGWRMGAIGWMGVDLFFVISGFLITSILLKTKTKSGYLRAFWMRRALRIFPLAYLYLSLLLVLGYLGAPRFFRGIQNLDEWPWFFFYLTNFRIALDGWVGPGINLLWSLAVEEQFYLLWPLVTLVLRPRHMVFLCILIVALSPVARFLTFIYADAPHPSVFVLPWCRFDGIAVGAILAVVLNDPQWRETAARWCRTLALPALGILIAIATLPLLSPDRGVFPRDNIVFAVFGYSGIAVSCGVLVGAAATPGRFTRMLLGNPVMTYIGKRSYGLYIWYPLVGHTIKYLAPGVLGGALSFSTTVLAWLLCLILVATLSWTLYEKRFLRLKRRFDIPRAATTKP